MQRIAVAISIGTHSSVNGTGPAPSAAPAPQRRRRSASYCTPRINTMGVPSSACPISSDAAAASSSARPTWVMRSARPNRSGLPRRSSSAGTPLAPIATPTVPLRQARPWLSLMMTADASRPCARATSCADRSHVAIRIGRQQQHARHPAASASTFEKSMPALAITNPSRCTTMITSRRARSTSATRAESAR